MIAFNRNTVSLNTHPARGFTLLEMMLALVVFAMVSLAAWQMLNTMTRARDVQSQHEARLRELDYAFLLMKQDFRQLVDRAPRVDTAVGTHSLLVEEGMLDSDDQGISFVRAGWQNSGHRLPRSNLQRVYYRLKDDVLERGYDPVLDKPPENDTEFRPLLTEVESLTFRFYVEGQWEETLMESKWPEAIAIQMDVTTLGRIERRFLIPSQWRKTDHGV